MNEEAKFIPCFFLGPKSDFSGMVLGKSQIKNSVFELWIIKSLSKGTTGQTTGLFREM